MRYDQRGGLTLLAGALALALGPAEARADGQRGEMKDERVDQGSDVRPTRDEAGRGEADRGEAARGEEQCQCPEPGREKPYSLGPLRGAKPGAAFGAGLGKDQQKHRGVPPSTGIGGPESRITQKPYSLAPLGGGGEPGACRASFGAGLQGVAPYTLGPIGGGGAQKDE